MNKHLHIISFDVPYPADYGGIIDVFYKIVWLHKCGVQIHLHCFTKGRAPHPELNKYCASVNYYKRNVGISSLLAGIPYIVKSRNNKSLLKALQQDNYPILMEGIHSTYLLHAGLLHNRKIFVRLHNIEHKYYHQLAKHERNIFKKIYFARESRLLKNYEKKIAVQAMLFALSTEDMEFYSSSFNTDKIKFVPAFLPWDNVGIQNGKGCYCLYHGNLSVNENDKAAQWLLKEVFNSLEIPFVIAGKNPSRELQQLAYANSHTCIVINPNEKEMQDMINKAQVNILPSFNTTGVKLKLLNALYNGRHCLVNTAAIQGAEISQVCNIAEDANVFKSLVQGLFQQEFTENEIKRRQRILFQVYNNQQNALQLIAWIY